MSHWATRCWATQAIHSAYSEVKELPREVVAQRAEIPALSTGIALWPRAASLVTSAANASRARSAQPAVSRPQSSSARLQSSAAGTGPAEAPTVRTLRAVGGNTTSAGPLPTSGHGLVGGQPSRSSGVPPRLQGEWMLELRLTLLGCEPEAWRSENRAQALGSLAKLISRFEVANAPIEPSERLVRAPRFRGAFRMAAHLDCDLRWFAACDGQGRPGHRPSRDHRTRDGHQHAFWPRQRR